MGPITLLKKIMNLGVTEDMAPEEARPIRFLNTFVLAKSPLDLFMFIQTMLLIIFRGWRWSAIEVELIVLTGDATIFLLNHRGRYKLARNFIIVLSNLALLIAYLYIGKGTLTHYFFGLMAGLAAILYPKKESLTMYLMIAMSVIFFLAAEFLGAEYAGAMIQPGALETYNSFMDFGILITVILLALVARYSTLGAEDRLLESRKKIAGLTEKLKVYLPRQFVDSLAKGDRGAEPDYKRRRLTIFFSDVRGFTAWTDKLEPEDTQEILNQYLSEMSAIANKWGGTIDKFIGDAIMIFFGDPEFTSDQDHALRCVKMALQMQEKMNALREEWEDKGHLEPLHIRIGVNTGYATVGNFGSPDRLNYTILGSAVNLASRLETASNPDRITISHMTWALIKGEIECEPKGEITVKGFAEPVKIYEVVGLNPSANSASA